MYDANNYADQRGCYQITVPEYKITRLILSYDQDKNAKLNNYFKNINRLGHPTLNSQAFQSLLMAQLEDLSPIVALDIKQ